KFWITGSGLGLTDIIGILSIVAALTPTPVDNAILGLLKTLTNIGGFNWGGARNAEKPALPKALDDLRKKLEKN
ncbi:MAG: hypothetical protein VKI81_11320, partial [Synechococcaceae cyanobacterium]|nr:hypothetical protein [Synechococcaceae cyanobacterium]